MLDHLILTLLRPLGDFRFPERALLSRLRTQGPVADDEFQAALQRLADAGHVRSVVDPITQGRHWLLTPAGRNHLAAAGA